MASSITASRLGGYSHAIFFTRPLPRPPKCVLKKKGNFLPFFFLSSILARGFPHPFFLSGWGTLHPLSEPRVSGFPHVRFSVGCPHPNFVRAKNSTACVVSASASVVSGGDFVHDAGVNCHYQSDPAIASSPQV